MTRFLSKAVLRPLALLSGGVLGATGLLGVGTPAQAAQPVVPHWGQYQWDGGQVKADIRAFWLLDRTGDPTMHQIIKHVTDQWNGSRTEHPELPFIAVGVDDANAGRCFVNQTPGYSLASACMMPGLSQLGIKGIAATQGSPHLIGGAFAISDGLSFEDAFTAVCHNFGHLMGLADSNDDASCMKHGVTPGVIKWYTQADADAVLALYAHDDGQAPVAVADTYTTAEDVALTVNAPGLLANDSDADSATLVAAEVSGPASGTATVNANGSFTYTPNANFNGTDSFTYKVSAGGTDSNVVTATIAVGAVADAPVAVADGYSTDEDTVLTVAVAGVLANDTDAEGAITAAKVTDPANGSVALDANGSFVYTPTANFNGTDSFTYKANDGTADSNVVTVTITVAAVNDAPVAVNDAYATTEAVAVTVIAPGALGNDTDAEAGALTAVKVSEPSNGTAVLSADGSLVYTPNVAFIGTDTFTYRANDGAADSNIATVVIAVTAPVVG